MVLLRIPKKKSFAYRTCHGTSLSCATLFSEFDVILLIPFQLRPPLFSSSQTISALLTFCNSFRQLAKLFHLSPLGSNLFTSSLLLSNFPKDSHLCPPRLHSPQLFSTRFSSSSTLPSSSHLRLHSTHLTSFSAHLNFSHLFNSGQLFSTLLTSCRKDLNTKSKLLHGETLQMRLKPALLKNNGRPFESFKAALKRTCTSQEGKDSKP